jgi:hypothetical protein
VSVEAAARVADLLLVKEGVRTGIFELVDGQEDIDASVKKVIEGQADS